MTPKMLLVWFSRQHEPAVPLESVPDHEALGVLMDRGHAMAWQSADGSNWAAPTVSVRARSVRTKTLAESDCYADYGRLDQMPSHSSDAIDPGFLASIAELSGKLVLGWERIGGRSVPWPVFIGLGCQPWPPSGTTIVKGRGGSMRLKRADAGEPCGVCGGRPLGPVAYCAACDRWGLDHLLKRETRPRRAAKVKVEVKTIKFAPRGRKEKAG